MSAIRSATAGVPSDTKAPEKPSAPQRVGLADYRRGFTLLRRFHGGRRPFVLGSLLLFVEAGAAVVEPIPIAYLIDYLQGQRAGPARPRLARLRLVGADRDAGAAHRRHHPARRGQQRGRLPRGGVPRPGRPGARLQHPRRDVLAPPAAVAGLPRQAPHG